MDGMRRRYEHFESYAWKFCWCWVLLTFLDKVLAAEDSLYFPL